ncbi:ras-associated and pleckstrin homology domains-containing protein 1a isoform X6 [Cyclopterus lumpus]|uniref:ras-associated and pleckstrin homology domains-containing protein 1a isoform X6 n=1 Tax=Cyclopterus lumpus TaxID=8103 RepID=UPI001486ABEB|nr:ras-associated and pleckstrin homology domains-containing protein 1a isoform X6 [Cyclopterus lumpus]
MDQLSDEEVSVRGEEEEEEMDSDKEDQDLDKMFGAWLGELDKLTQVHKSLDESRPEPPPQQKAPLRQETNMANFSYRFSIYNINEALNQGQNVDLDSLMADLCSIEQELSTINAKPNSIGSMARLGLTDTKVRQKPPAGRSSRQQPAGGGGSGGGSGGGGGNSVSGGGGSSGASSSSSSARASPAGTIRAPGGPHGRPALASNFSLDDITAQLEKASLSMDEAARQTSSHSLSSASSYTSATMRRPGSSQRQHRRTGSVGTVSEHEARSIAHSSRSSVTSASGVSVNSASSMDSLDSVLRADEPDGQQPPSAAGAGHPNTEHSYLDRETSLILRNIAGKPSHLLTKEEQAAKLKADNIRVALEKIKEAQVKKLVIRVHLSDESSKTMMVDERQTVRQVLDSLLEKSHCGYSPDWSLVETINELQMERIFEDHENLVENLLNWTRDSQNRLMFTERIEKYALFKNPQNYLLGRKETCEMAERNKEALLEECFGGSTVSVPEMEGVLWLKEDGKKSWKKRYFLLRASGIYYVPKGKAKASRDLVCFLQLDHVNVYHGQDYKSKYKAPTDYCMVLKHPQIQKKSQYIKYLCCDDVRTLQQWINSIRIAKYGKQLYVNFQEAMRRTEAAYDWSSLSSSSIKSGSSSSLPESQSNHSSQSDSGVSEMTSSGHTRSQSAVSSIFSDAWRRGTQGEMMRIDPISRPIPVQILSPQPLTPPSRTSYTDGLVPSDDSSSPSPPSPPPPPMATVTHQPASTPSYVKYSTLARLQSQNQSRTQPFPGNSAPSSLPASNSMEGSKLTAPQSPPAVKAKPKWQPGGVVAPQSPEFPPPPSDGSMGEFPLPSASSTGSSSKRGPPPAPQRASSISMRCGSSGGETQDERPTKVESLVSKFGQTPQTGTSSSSSSATGSPSKDSSALPAPLPKPGKLNLANLPLALQGLQTGQHHQPSEFPSPPPPPPPAEPPHLDSSPDYFPPPPSDFELFPPPPHPSEFHHPPKIAVVNPQPQMHPPQQSAPSSLSSSSWKQGSLKKGAVLPPTLNRRISNATQYDTTMSMPLSPLPLSQTPPPSLSSYSTSSSPVPPTSPKSPGPSTLALKPHFLEDLNRTLKRKSVSRHGSLTSTHLISSSKMEPVGTMDDMALLPPPPPELLQQGVRGHSQTLSRHHTHSHSTKHASISGYATLRRGPPPAPPKRDQNTKLTGDW